MQEQPNQAYATLVTNDGYVPGALVLASSLRLAGSRFPIVCLVTGVSQEKRDLLASHFSRVIDVDMLRSFDHENLRVLGRSELDVTWTKLRVFGLSDYDQLAFLDADTLIVRNIDDIFDHLDSDAVFAAAPDIGWPDCFNSGVFVTRPSQDLYADLLRFVARHGSFDGGDQGILNQYFRNWSFDVDRQDPLSPKTRRLPFTFNVTPSSYYSYMPAFNHFRNDIRVVHFIGQLKPWHYDRFQDGRVVSNNPLSSKQYNDMVQEWWNVFDRSNLDHHLDSKWNLTQQAYERKEEKAKELKEEAPPRSDFCPPPAQPVYTQPQMESKPKEKPNLPKPVEPSPQHKPPVTYENRSNRFHAPSPVHIVRLHGHRESSRTPSNRTAHSAYDYAFASAPGLLPPPPPALPQPTPHHTAYVPPHRHAPEPVQLPKGSQAPPISDYRVGWDHREFHGNSKRSHGYAKQDFVWGMSSFPVESLTPENANSPTTPKLSLKEDTTLKLRSLYLDDDAPTSIERQAESGVSLMINISHARQEYKTVITKSEVSPVDHGRPIHIPRVKPSEKKEGMAWGLTGGSGKYDKMMKNQNQWFRTEQQREVMVAATAVVHEPMEIGLNELQSENNIGPLAGLPVAVESKQVAPAALPPAETVAADVKNTQVSTATTSSLQASSSLISDFKYKAAPEVAPPEVPTRRAKPLEPSNSLYAIPGISNATVSPRDSLAEGTLVEMLLPERQVQLASLSATLPAESEVAMITNDMRVSSIPETSPLASGTKPTGKIDVSFGKYSFKSSKKDLFSAQKSRQSSSSTEVKTAVKETVEVKQITESKVESIPSNGKTEHAITETRISAKKETKTTTTRIGASLALETLPETAPSDSIQRESKAETKSHLVEENKKDPVTEQKEKGKSMPMEETVSSDQSKPESKKAFKDSKIGSQASFVLAETKKLSTVTFETARVPSESSLATPATSQEGLDKASPADSQTSLATASTSGSRSSLATKETEVKPSVPVPVKKSKASKKVRRRKSKTNVAGAASSSRAAR